MAQLPCSTVRTRDYAEKSCDIFEFSRDCVFKGASARRGTPPEVHPLGESRRAVQVRQRLVTEAKAAGWGRIKNPDVRGKLLASACSKRPRHDSLKAELQRRRMAQTVTPAYPSAMMSPTVSPARAIIPLRFPELTGRRIGTTHDPALPPGSACGGGQDVPEEPGEGFRGIALQALSCQFAPSAGAVYQPACFVEH